MSGAQYAFHLGSHRIALLWRLHRVHHCDVHLDASSALRFHPLEMLANIAFVAPIVMVCGLPAATVAVYEGVQIIAGMVTHANLRIPDALERAVGRVLVTPAVHRIHHSADLSEANSNFGNMLLLWDQLFGSYDDGSRLAGRPSRFGVREMDREGAGNLICLLESPWHKLTPAPGSGVLE
jgi:sterol desaturase/sphingolipid hydroxylase (fatty acid hydroxylase superfamily)